MCSLPKSHLICHQSIWRSLAPHFISNLLIVCRRQLRSHNSAKWWETFRGQKQLKKSQRFVMTLARPHSNPNQIDSFHYVHHLRWRWDKKLHKKKESTTNRYWNCESPERCTKKKQHRRVALRVKQKALQTHYNAIIKYQIWLFDHGILCCAQLEPQLLRFQFLKETISSLYIPRIGFGWRFRHKTLLRDETIKNTKEDLLRARHRAGFFSLCCCRYACSTQIWKSFRHMELDGWRAAVVVASGLRTWWYFSSLLAWHFERNRAAERAMCLADAKMCGWRGLKL